MKMTLLLLTVAFLMPAAALALPAPAQGTQTGPSDSGTSTTITPRHLISRVGTIGVGGYSLPFYTVPVGPPQGSFPVPPIPSGFPAIRYHLTAHQASQLGVYLIRGESILLAPRGLQEAYAPRRGTDGNLVVRLENPSSPRKEWISISSIPACQGCAYDAARSWLPWVKRNSDNSWCGDGECKRNIKPGLSYARLGKEVTAISYESPYGAHVNGIVLYSPNEDNPVYLTYESAWFYAPTLGHQIATAVLNFFYKYDIRQQHLLMAMSSRQLAHSTVGNAKLAGIVGKHEGSEHYDSELTAKKKQTSERIQIVSVICKDTVVGPEVEGQVKNVSDQSIGQVLMSAVFEDSAKNFVSTTDEIPAQFDPILPGQVSPYDGYGDENPVIASVTVVPILVSGATIPFSGNNVAACTESP